jgi:hypothetical protein
MLDCALTLIAATDGETLIETALVQTGEAGHNARRNSEQAP